METQTNKYTEQTEICAAVFQEKLAKYGTSFICLRPISFVTQLLNKVERLKNLQSIGWDKSKVAETEVQTFSEIYNYAIIGQMLDYTKDVGELNDELYRHIQACVANLFEQKNNDYGDAWRKMSVMVITDFIHTKLFRLRVEIENGMSNYDSECYADVANYAVFAMILLSEAKQ